MGHGLYILFNAVQYLKECFFRVKFDVKESFHGLYFINGTRLMGTLFQKVFFYWTFCGCFFMFTEIKPEK